MKEIVKTDKFNTGSYALPRTAEKVEKYTLRSRMKGSGHGDALKAALGHRPQVLPKGMVPFSHSKTARPTGARYTPTGAFGSMSRTGQGRGVYSYGKNRFSAKPSNAVGSPDGGRGGNAVGSPPNRRGSHA